MNKQIILFVSIIFILLGNYYVFVGIHNLDNIQNLERINLMYGLNLTETELHFNQIRPISHIEGWYKGMCYIIVGLYTTLLGGILFGGNLPNKELKKKQEKK